MRYRNVKNVSRILSPIAFHKKSVVAEDITFYSHVIIDNASVIFKNCRFLEPKDSYASIISFSGNIQIQNCTFEGFTNKSGIVLEDSQVEVAHSRFTSFANSGEGEEQHSGRTAAIVATDSESYVKVKLSEFVMFVGKVDAIRAEDCAKAVVINSKFKNFVDGAYAINLVGEYGNDECSIADVLNDDFEYFMGKRGNVKESTIGVRSSGVPTVIRKCEFSQFTNNAVGVLLAESATAEIADNVFSDFNRAHGVIADFTVRSKMKNNKFRNMMNHSRSVWNYGIYSKSIMNKVRGAREKIRSFDSDIEYSKRFKPI